ncbi:MAG: M4 family metallopeptidase [Kofleriaceae bacterium]
MKHVARFLLLCVAGCVAGGDSAPPAATFRIDRLDHAGDGKPYFVHGTLGHALAPIQTLGDVDLALSSALPEIARSIGVPANELIATRVSHDAIGMTHVIYDQRANDLPVVGGRIAVHVAADGTIAGVTNSARDVSALPVAPSIAASYAAETARTETAKGAATAGATDLVYVITNADGDVHLAWQVDVRAQHALVHDLVYIDATTGTMVARHPLIQPVKNRSIYTGNGADFEGPGSISVTLLGNEATAPTEPIGTLAFDNTGITYDVYHDLFQRDSYDNAGAELQSIVHVTFGGGNGDNAFWDGKEMVYGDGDGTQFGEFARALDVTAHELTHAVTGATAGLVYEMESGALNEASSDIMGAVVEEHHAGAVSANTWLVGEDVYTPSTPGDALRYMSNPTLDAPLYNNQYSSSDYYPERLMLPDTQDGDFGGVHFNSGIANLAFYLLSEGGSHPRHKTPYTAIGIGIDKAGAIWQRALTQGYFMPNTNFAQARTATEQVANELYPGAAKGAVSLAWATVGVGAAPVDTVPPVVHITAPITGTSVQAGFEVDATATDDEGVLRVDFSVDGAVVGSSTTSPYTFTTAATLAPGSHVIAATAYDAINHTSDSVTVTIIDPTCGGTCTADETCDSTTGACVANPDNGGEGGGCCSSSRGNAGGSLLLFAATGLVIARRRRRR